MKKLFILILLVFALCSSCEKKYCYSCRAYWGNTGQTVSTTQFCDWTEQDAINYENRMTTGDLIEDCNRH